jgi:hypothetical protein
MSDETKKQLDTLLAKIAALEVQLNARPAAAPQTPTGIDPQRLAQALMTDPVGTMRQLNVPVDHVNKILVAHTLGDAAPLELRMLAQQGPLMSAQASIASDVQALRQRLETYEERDKKAARRENFSALAADKTKYPTLAAAYAKNPAIFNDVENFQGDVAAYAEATEKQLATLAPVFTPPASSANAETSGQSSQAKQAHVGGIDPTPPPIPNSKPGVFTQETHEEVKARILARYPQNPNPA